MTAFLDALVRLIDYLAPFSPSLISFVLGWGLFEVQERRRRAMQGTAVRTALLVELEHAEAILSTLVTRFAMGADDPSEGIKELRWYVRQGRRMIQVDEPPPELLAVAERPDEELATFFRAMNPTRHPGLGLSMPIVDSILGSPGVGLSREQYLKITAVKWQAQLLATIVADMREWLHYSFTIEDPDNHALVEGNYLNARSWYGKRSKYTLDAVREALAVLRNGGHVTGSQDHPVR